MGKQLLPWPIRYTSSLRVLSAIHVSDFGMAPPLVVALTTLVSLAFGPLRLLDGTIAAPGREGPGVYLEVVLEGGDCGDGVIVRREFDSRGAVISITASPHLASNSKAA